MRSPGVRGETFTLPGIFRIKRQQPARLARHAALGIRAVTSAPGDVEGGIGGRAAFGRTSTVTTSPSRCGPRCAETSAAWRSSMDVAAVLGRQSMLG